MDATDNTREGASRTLHDDFAKAEQAGRDVVTRFLSHPKAAAVITEHRDAVRDLVPDVMAPDQWGATDLGQAAGIWPATGSAWVRSEARPLLGSDHSRWPVLVDSTDPRITSGPWSAGWPTLAEDTRAQLRSLIEPVRDALVALADDLAQAGVPVDPGSALDICALAQLTICNFDLTRPAAELVAEMNLSAPFAIPRDGRGIKNLRDGTGVRVQTAANRIRQWWRAQQDDDRSAALRADAAEGGRRAARTNTDRQKRRRDALRQVLDEYPNIGEMSDRSAAANLCRTYDKKGTAGGRLAELLGTKRPADTTLAKDLTAIRPIAT